MRQYGYEGIFRQKSRESMGQYGKVDGCAIFWTATKLHMVDYFDIDFNEEARQDGANRNLDEASLRRYLTRVHLLQSQILLYDIMENECRDSAVFFHYHVSHMFAPYL